jgi:hypothetical protein
MNSEGLTGTIPTNVGLLTSLTALYATCHPPPCMYVLNDVWELTWDLGFVTGTYWATPTSRAPCQRSSAC